ncbi:cobalamin synthesis protein/P47K:Cobalamin synthesis protein-like protein/P47K [Plenodomus tracheiphilus IPT5]|uniref:Cobalamin synthesis protein/P47K:Cobalamin synthesis protein-like protein/P47K n=1 Tax=Plenodomus tracheiphilus IPT5 TaxID=1408161 RepID=A0A6A7BJ65_9PLEO|nr:cobalamin synthesis protein/P47K:Cobalamin synthesis protein-like protein/P47K [Plenodomus tracheiphilus IPT5]
MAPIPITIITGFLGSGKTTLILNLLPQLPPTYKLALLKNEFGSLPIDSALAASSSISSVRELLNGCICCNLVGQLSTALSELASLSHPDRIVIETSGSAFPATLAMEINRLARETGNYVLDGVLSVIDVENWGGYEDTSLTAKMQARYTDLIVLNKWEGVGERRVEDVEDKILALEVEPQIPRTRSRKGWVGKEIVFGLDARLAGEEMGGLVGTEAEEGHGNGHDHGHSSEVEVLSVRLDGKGSVDREKLARLLEDPTKDEVYRIKGILYASTPPKSSDLDLPAANGASEGRARYILNWAFGRWTFTPVPLAEADAKDEEPPLRLTIVTAKYESNKWKKQIESSGLIALADGGADAQLTVERVA